MFSTAFASSTPRVAPAASLSASRRGSSAIAPLAVKCRGRTRVSSRRRHLVRTRAADLPDDPFKVRARPTATSDPTPQSQSPSSPLDRPAHVSPSVFSASSSPSSTHQDFSLGKLAKKVQGSIPVVSLVSKLSPQRGASAQTPFSYNEYCRAKLDAAGGTDFGASLSELCDESHKEPRTLLLLTWMAYEGDGLLPPDLARSAAARLSSTGFDYEYEIYRFEQARDEAIENARRETNRRGTTRGRALAEEALVACCFGASGAERVSEEMRRHVTVVAEGAVRAI